MKGVNTANVHVAEEPFFFDSASTKLYAGLHNHLSRVLSKKRYQHSINVAEASVKLARRWRVNQRRAYVAGLCHDCCKDMTLAEQKRLAAQCRFAPTTLELSVPALLHAIAGCWYTENVLRISDKTVLAAIRYHTEARAGMSRLEEVVYMADLTSADRNFKDVERFRRLAQEDLNLAMLESLRFYVADVVSKGAKLPLGSVEAYNQYTFIAAKNR